MAPPPRMWPRRRRPACRSWRNKQMAMRVAMIDPSLFTLPYDEKLAEALQRRGHRIDFFGKALGARDPAPATVPLRQHFYGSAQTLRTERWPGPLAQIA